VAYAWYEYRFPSWKEEVVLPDGRKIIVKQRRDFIEGRGTRRTWLTFSLPEMGAERTWSEHMEPLLIAANGHDVWVAGWPAGYAQFAAYGLPRNGYVAFKWNGQDFSRVPFVSIPEALRQEQNLIRCVPETSYVSWQAKLPSGCDGSGRFLHGVSRKIDLSKMQAWANENSRLRNTTPQSD
jgi:hypothetical protein